MRDSSSSDQLVDHPSRPFWAFNSVWPWQARGGPAGYVLGVILYKRWTDSLENWENQWQNGQLLTRPEQSDISQSMITSKPSGSNLSLIALGSARGVQVKQGVCCKNATWRWSEPTCQCHTPSSVYLVNGYQLLANASYTFLRYELTSSLNFGPVTDGRTDRQKAMHMSPPCISTGVLKNKSFNSFVVVIPKWGLAGGASPILLRVCHRL